MRSGSSQPSGATLLTGPYLARNRGLLAFLAVADALLSLARSRDPVSIPRDPQRVLLALGGQLGDAVIATAALQYLHDAIPTAAIGIVLPSWSRPVLDGDSRLRWIHTVDHWKPNRSGASSWTRWRRYRDTQRVAVREIRDVGYDVAVDLYGYFPNMATVLRRAAIPTRLGFTSGGFGPMYTHSLPWTDDERHVAERQVELVRLLVPEAAPAHELRYALPRTPRQVATTERVTALLAAEGLESGSYVAIHLGSGSEQREWPARQWARVLAPLSQDGHRLVFTGRGEREAASIATATRGLLRVTNLGDRLSWDDFVEVLRRARLVITIETAAAHIAAATGTPCVAVWSRTTNPAHWGPLGSRVALVFGRVPGAPHTGSPGAAETRQHELPANEVLHEARRMLAATSRLRHPSTSEQAQVVL